MYKMDKTLIRGEFHSRDGLHFSRDISNGDVHIRVYGRYKNNEVVEFETTLTDDEWASVVATVSAQGETRETWLQARSFHAGTP